MKLKNLLIIYLFGLFGVHKFMGGETKMGILYFCTLGLFGVGWIYDMLACLFYPGDYIHKKTITNNKNSNTSQNNKKANGVQSAGTKQNSRKVEKNSAPSKNGYIQVEDNYHKESVKPIKERYDEFLLEKRIVKEIPAYDNYLPAFAAQVDIEYSFRSVLDSNDEIYSYLDELSGNADYKIITYSSEVTSNNYTVTILVYKIIEFDDSFMVLNQNYSLVYTRIDDRDDYSDLLDEGDVLDLSMNYDDRLTVYGRKRKNSPYVFTIIGEVSKKDTRELSKYFDDESYVIMAYFKEKITYRDNTNKVYINVKVYDIYKYLLPKAKKEEEEFCNSIVNEAILSLDAKGYFELDDNQGNYTSLFYNEKEILQVCLDRRNSWARICISDTKNYSDEWNTINDMSSENRSRVKETILGYINNQQAEME